MKNVKGIFKKVGYSRTFIGKNARDVVGVSRSNEV